MKKAPYDGFVRDLMSAIPTPNIICNRGLLFTILLVGRLLDTTVTINGSRVSFDPNKKLFCILLGSSQEPPHSHCKAVLSLGQKPWIEVRDWLLNIYLLSQLSVRRIYEIMSKQQRKSKQRLYREIIKRFVGIMGNIQSILL